MVGFTLTWKSWFWTRGCNHSFTSFIEHFLNINYTKSTMNTYHWEAKLPWGSSEFRGGRWHATDNSNAVPSWVLCRMTQQYREGALIPFQGLGSGNTPRKRWPQESSGWANKWTGAVVEFPVQLPKRANARRYVPAASLHWDSHSPSFKDRSWRALCAKRGGPTSSKQKGALAGY